MYRLRRWRPKNRGGGSFPRTRRRPLQLTRGSGSWHEIEEKYGLTVLGLTILQADDCIVLHVRAFARRTGYNEAAEELAGKARCFNIHTPSHSVSASLVKISFNPSLLAQFSSLKLPANSSSSSKLFPLKCSANSHVK